MTEDKKKYNHMENVFQYLNKNYVSLDENQIKRNNIILHAIVTDLINTMKKKDVLFKSLYRQPYYGGSYYDGLKIGQPEEYDLDLLLCIPKFAEPAIVLSSIPGFVHLQLTELEKFKKQSEYNTNYFNISNLLDEQNYLCTTNVLKWIEALVTKSLKEYPESGTQSVFEVASKKYYIQVSKGGPAFTLKINGETDDETTAVGRMDIDLVPCFVFTNDKWPSGAFRQNPFAREKPQFFIVPKEPKGSVSEASKTRYWRLSFQEQERELMHGKETLKPALKLLKKLRDKCNHSCISSYFIKTVFLWEVEKCDQFRNTTLSVMYISMLKVYAGYIENKNIPYYWDRNFNLINNVNDVTLSNIGNKLRNIISEIDRNITDPYVGAKALLTQDEYEKLKQQVPISQKHIKKSLLNNSSQDESNSSLTTFAANMNELHLKVDEHDKSIEKILIFVEKFENKCRDLEIKMDAITEENERLKTELYHNEEARRIADLFVSNDLKVNAHEKCMERISTYVDKLEKKFDDLDTKFETLKAENDQLKRQVNQNEERKKLLNILIKVVLCFSSACFNGFIV